MALQSNNLGSLPPPPKGQTGVTLNSLKNLPPPPQGQTGMTLNQVQQPQNQGQNPLSLGLNAGLNFAKDQSSQAFQGGAQQVSQGFNEIQNAQNSGGNVLKNTGNALEGAIKTDAGVINSAFSGMAPLTAPIGAGVNYLADKISNNPLIQKFAQSGAGKAVSRTAENVGNLSTIAATGAGLAGPKEIANTAVDTVANPLKKGFENSVQTLQDAGAKSPQQVNSTILENYNKAIKPSTAGKNNFGNIVNSDKNVITAIKSIAENKPNLSFSDETGDLSQGRTPETPKELSSAVSQTKSSIFKKYDAQAQAAGEAGIKVDSTSIAKSLDDVINNEGIKVANPSAIKYAQELKSRFGNENSGFKQFSPGTTQDIIKAFNESLDAFYAKPSYETASRAAIDAGVVKGLRSSLDESINKVTGENYQQLKNQYGALSSIEKDVARRSAMIDKQSGNSAGLGKYVDIFAGGDMVNGLLSLNPALFAKGAAQSAISRVFQYLNSPDRAIKGMFDAVEQGNRTLVNTQGGFIKNPLAQDTKPSVTPESTKGMMSSEDLGMARKIVNENSLQDYMKAQPMLKTMGIDKLGMDDQVRFLKEAIDHNTTKLPVKSPNFTKGDKGLFSGSTPRSK